MENNKQRKSYYLAEALGAFKPLYFDTLQEANDKAEYANKYNSKKKNQFFYGHEKIEKIGDKYRVVFIKWKKLTEADELKKIDEKTMFYNDQAELKRLNPDFNVKQKNNVYVVYRYNKNINYIDTMYKNDYMYLEKDYLVKSIYNLYNIKTGIFNKIRNNVLFDKSSQLAESFEDIAKVLGCIQFDGYSSSYLLLSPIHKLVYTYIMNSKTHKLDYKKLRDLGMFIKQEEILNEDRMRQYKETKDEEIKNKSKARQRSFFDEI